MRFGSRSLGWSVTSLFFRYRTWPRFPPPSLPICRRLPFVLPSLSFLHLFTSNCISPYHLHIPLYIPISPVEKHRSTHSKCPSTVSPSSSSRRVLCLLPPVDFSNATVIVTGGNRGIGRAISETLAKAGANVAIIYNSAKDAPEVAAEIAKEHNVKVQAWKCDVGNTDIVKKTFQEINDTFGQVTGLVANAGVSVVKDALDMKKEDFSFVCKPITSFVGQGCRLWVDDVNVWGQFACAQAAADLWTKSGFKKGSIVLTSSMSSQIVNKGIHQVFYNSSKAAASSIVKQLAVEVSNNSLLFLPLC